LAINTDYIKENILFQTSEKIEIKGIVDTNVKVEHQVDYEVLFKPNYVVSIKAIFHAHREECN